MHVVGDVGGRAAGRQVGVVAQDDALAAWPGSNRRPGHLPREAGERDVVEADLGQRGGVAFATARIGIDQLDETAHATPVANDHRRFARAAATSLLPTTRMR